MQIIKPSVTLEWTTPNALQVIEKAGRTCYKSESNITDQSAEAFVRKIIKSGHDSVLEHATASFRFITDRGCCYHPDMMVLTVHGWKTFNNVSADDEVFTINNENKLTKIKPVRKLEYDYDGDLYEIESTQISLLVTPNHNCWVFDYDKRSKLTRQWKFLQACQLTNGRYGFEKSCQNSLIPEDKDAFVCLPELISKRGFYNKIIPKSSFNSVDFWELIGIWATDGSLSPIKNGSGHRITISQTKQNVKTRIEALLKTLKLNFSIYKNEYRINSSQLFKFLYDNFIMSYVDKMGFKKTYYIRVPRSFAENNNTKNITAFLKGVIEGDGSTSNDGRIGITTVSEGFAQDLVELFLKIGKCANYYPNGKPDRQHSHSGILFKSTVQAYTVSVIRTTRPMLSTKRHPIKSVKYHGKVMCLELPKYHRLYVMRNGKPIWCGNSHELVRHRVASFSQESTRYCSYSKEKFGSQISIVHPNGLTEEQIIRRNELFEKVQTLYMQELNEGISPQLARGVLPTSLKTEIVCTANFREWRHILKLRTSKAAHPQIVEVMRMAFQWFMDNYSVIVEDIKLD